MMRQGGTHRGLYVRPAAVLLLLCLAACATPALRGDAPFVEISSGTLSGLWVDETTHSAAFLGVPFAAPPLGDLRWRAPQMPNNWDGLKTATGFAPACMQGPHIVDWYKDVVIAFGGDPSTVEGPVSVSEDCLYLNIWTPDLKANAPAPVMVWIHGGSNVGGWSYEPNYRGAKLSEQGIVVVTIAYRLGVFGYLAPEENGDFNAGLLDQIAALRWVRENIAAFGGDPENVTIFGESAGAAAVGTLMTAPGARGLFRRAMSQSGGFEFVDMPSTADVSDAVATLQDAFPEKPLRKIPATDLLAASEVALADYSFYPVVDGVSLMEMPQTARDGGRLHPVDLLIGTNRDEWLMYLDADTQDTDLAKWRDRLNTPETIDALVAESGLLGTLDRLETAEQMRCPGYALAKAVGAGGQQAFVYLFTRVRPGEKATEFGSYHGAEIPYVFGTHDDWLPTDETDWRLTDAMMTAWVGFATSGVPALEGERVWPAFEIDGAVLEWGDRIALRKALDADLCDIIPQ